MLSYYNFDFKKYLDININSFSVEQEELLLIDNSNNQSRFKKNNIKYNCTFIKQKNWNKNNPTIIIPIKDNSELLKFTILNLKTFKIDKYCNIMIIDDRSKDQEIKYLSLEHKLSYIRIENEKGFNFSMLNNIAALIAYKLESNTIILWNSDLWTNDENTLKNLLKKHFEENSIISGTKLLYPPRSMSFHKEEFLNNINFERSETIQFGGADWINTNSPIKLSPIHRRRFKEKNDILSTCDKTETFVTGAFQIIDLKWFMDIGGFNPSLSKNFQDVDLCLKAVENNKKILYFGKNDYLYHDESVSLEKEGKYDIQLLNDHILFGKIWNEKIDKLIF